MRCEDPDATVRDVTLVRALIFLSCTTTVFACVFGLFNALNGRMYTTAVLRWAYSLCNVFLLIFCKYCVRSARRSSMNTRPTRCPALPV